MFFICHTKEEGGRPRATHTCDQVLAVGRKERAFGVRLLAEFDLARDLCGAHLLLLVLDGRLAAEQIDLCARRQQALVLLPLQRLAEQRQQPGRRHHRHLAAQLLCDGRAALLFAAAVHVRLARIEVGSLQHILQVNVSFAVLLLQHNHRIGLAEQRTGGAQFAQLDELQHDLLVQIDELLVGQFERLDCLQHGVPVAIVNVGDESFDAVNCVQRDAGLFLPVIAFYVIKRVVFATD